LRKKNGERGNERGGGNRKGKERIRQKRRGGGEGHIGLKMLEGDSFPLVQWKGGWLKKKNKSQQKEVSAGRSKTKKKKKEVGGKKEI